MRVLRSEFICGAPDAGALPPEPSLPEIALIGRANVGKSTLLNLLTGRKQLARASGTPGRTRELNCFQVDLEFEGREHSIRLIDLPGFGYGKMSKKERERMHAIVVDYARERGAITAACLLNDVRRNPEDDEFAVRRLLFEEGVPLLVVATKSDKLNQKERARRGAELAQAYGLEVHDLVFTAKGKSPNQLWKRIHSLIE